MLVLTRRVGEEIVIGDNIRVTVVMVRGQSIRLGISAPTSVPIARLELLPACARATLSPPTGRQSSAIAVPPSADRDGTGNDVQGGLG
jgi:carbon storage regulator CsrA